MAEQLVNEFTVNRPIDEAWAVITDVERIAPCLPGAQLQEIEGDIYRGVVKIKLGSITPAVQGSGHVHRARRHRPPRRAQGRGPRHRWPRQRVGRDRGAGREPVADEHARRRHHRPAHHRQGRPVRPRHHRRRLQEADGAVRRQPQHDARRPSPTPPPADGARPRPPPSTARRLGGDRRSRRRPRARWQPTRRVPRRSRSRAAEGAQDRQPGERAGRPRRDRRTGDPQAAGPGRSAVCCCCCSSCVDAASLTRSAGPMDGDDVARVTALLGRAPQGRSRWSSATATANPSSSATHPFLDDGTPMPTRYWLVGADDGAGRQPARGGRRRAARRRPRSTRRPIADAHAGTPPSATRPSPPTCRPAPVRRGRRARARASSACTPTTPGTSPAATIRSAGGSLASSPIAPRRRGRAVVDRPFSHAGRDIARSPSGPSHAAGRPTSSIPTRRRPSS